MDNQAAIRRVRIAVSVFFGVMTVALCVLWVRSCWRVDRMYYATGPKVVVFSSVGILGVTIYPTGLRLGGYPEKSSWLNDDVNEFESRIARIPNWSWNTQAPRILSVTCPFWFVAAISVGIAFLPWAASRFSLRTLLVATTLIAVVLGLGGWLVR